MKDIYVIDIMNRFDNDMVYDIFGVWATQDGAVRELQRINDTVNESNMGILRATINENTCSVESSESGSWQLLSRLHITKKPINFDKVK